MPNIVDLLRKANEETSEIRGNKQRSVSNEEKISKLTTDVTETRSDVKKLKIDLELQGKAFEKGLLYYGYPTDIGGLYEVDLCVPVYGSFDVVVFGDGYQKSSHEEHSNLVQILTKLKQYPTKAFGYVPIGCLTPEEDDETEGSNRTMEQLKQDVDDWYNTGVQGIFLDEYGFDYRVTRERQNEIVDYIHEKGLHVIANSWEPDYVFSTSNTLSVTAGNTKNFIGNPNGLECHLTDEDYLLFEHLLFVATGSASTKIKAQEAWDVYRIQEYYEKYYNTYHVRPFMVNSIPSKSTTEQVQEYQRLSAIAGVVLCCDCVGLSAENWSADTNKYFTVLPPQDRAKFKFINVSEKSGRPYKYQVQIDQKTYTLIYTMKSDTDTTYSNTKIYGEINGDKNAVLNPNFIEVYDSISNINSRLASISQNADAPVVLDVQDNFTISTEGIYVLTLTGNCVINVELPENCSCTVVLKSSGFTCTVPDCFKEVPTLSTDASGIDILRFTNYGKLRGYHEYQY